MARNADDLLSTAQVARELKVTQQQVGNLIRDGVLIAKKVGRGYVVRRGDLEKLPKYRKPGPKSEKRS